jgi:peptide chain release factor subunit 3
MNPNAASFNPNASAFVPSWAAAPAPEPAATPEARPAQPKEVKEAIKVEAQKAASPTPPRVATPPSNSATNLADKLSRADLEDVKEHCNLVFIGHVDGLFSHALIELRVAGKSTMGGHLLLITGMVDKRTMEKYEREAKELGRESW